MGLEDGIATTVTSETTETTEGPTILAEKYELGDVLGTGGMGTVYRATHLVLGCPVAVKLMHGTTDASMAGRFLREARLAAAARHPNVVGILDFGTTPDGVPFMVMELLEGTSLADLMDHGAPLNVDAQVAIIEQVLSGLDAVHRAGIVHRDLKPANVFVTPLEDGPPIARLLDFGISFSVHPSADLERGRFGTDAHSIIGTPEYMSLEQAEGRPDVDVRADVYAVGVMLYELLSGGQLPYSDPNPGSVLFKVFSGEHTPLSAIRPDLPELCAVVEQALQRDREHRPPTAHALRRAILHAHGRYERSEPEIELIPKAAPPRSSVPSMRPILAPDSITAMGPSIPMLRRWRTPVMFGLAGLALAVLAGSTLASDPAVSVAEVPVAATTRDHDSPPSLAARARVGSDIREATTVSVVSVPSAPILEGVRIEATSHSEESARPARGLADHDAARARPSIARPAESRPERTRPRAGEVIRELDF
jgi:serine/threonine-protein kinase